MIEQERKHEHGKDYCQGNPKVKVVLRSWIAVCVAVEDGKEERHDCQNVHGPYKNVHLCL